MLEGIDGGASSIGEDSLRLAETGARKDLVALTSGLKRKPARGEAARKAQKLQLCRGCNQYIARSANTCPHCEGDVKSLRLAYNKELRSARRAEKRLAELMNI